MSRPSLGSRPKRDVAGVVADMLGTVGAVTVGAPTTEAEKPKAVETEKPPTVKTEIPREKTSFAIRPDVKRHLTVLKLDLRAAGHRVTEAEIVEALIANADVGSLEALLS